MAGTHGARRGASLVGLLVVVLLIAVAGVFLYGRTEKSAARTTRPGGPTTQLGQSMEKGTEVECQNNLRQIRTAVSMARLNDAENSAPPASLEALRSEGISPTMLACPVTKQPYKYNPQTGQAWCPVPGHERF